MKQVKGIKRFKHPIIEEIDHRAVVHSIGSRVNSTAITPYGDRW